MGSRRLASRSPKGWALRLQFTGETNMRTISVVVCLLVASILLKPGIQIK
jgi:hypothetical protein